MVSYLVIVQVGISLLSTLGIILFFVALRVSERRAPRFYDSIKELEQTTNQATRKKVSIIIAAKNEEQTIGRCLVSLLNQTYQNYEILAVDDGSIDRTSEAVQGFESKDFRLRLLRPGEKPEGWVGKNWPCWRGFEESKGELLLFLDADSTYQAKTLEYCVQYFGAKGIDMLSISPMVELHGIWAHSIMPFLSGIINLLYPMTEVNDPKSKKAYVFGSFILVKRSVYEAIGGHKEIKDRIVEDAAIAENAKRNRYRLRVEIGGGLALTEWERKFWGILHGLERVSSHSIRNYGLLSILNAILLFFVVLFPIFSLVGFGFDLAFGRGLISQDILILWVGLATSLVAIVFMLAMVASELKLISKNVGAYPALYPLGCIIFIIAILMASIKIAQDRGIEWKGASYKQAKVSRK